MRDHPLTVDGRDVRSCWLMSASADGIRRNHACSGHRERQSLQLTLKQLGQNYPMSLARRGVDRQRQLRRARR